MKKTPLYDEHVRLGGKMVDFAGWLMPLHYGSQLVEHQVVRESAGVFDVSHMAIFDINDKQAKDFLRFLLANDVNKISPGKALYSCMLNEDGGILDDLIVYHLDENSYRIVSNASTREKNYQWFQKQASKFQVSIKERNDLGILAVQGPKAINIVKNIISDPRLAQLPSFEFASINEILFARTGYTGEDGYEIIIPIAKQQEFWQSLLAAGVKPCGLGARDTLRLEAGLNLYGTDMDETTTPLESNLAWTVAWQDEARNFVGKEVLGQNKKEGVKRKLIGLVMQERGVLRNHQRITLENGTMGEITSGTFSPTLRYSIAFARMNGPIVAKGVVAMRDKEQNITVVKLPFVRHGKSVYKELEPVTSAG